MNRVILMPVFNDWRSATMLIERLETELAAADLTADILLVDDGSPEHPPTNIEADYQAIKRVGVLSLRRNLGHQRAIAVGLAFVADQLQCDQLIIMDSDGEDAPEDVPKLISALAATSSPAIVFAERRRRSESLLFQTCYFIYRNLHHILTGEKVRFGNFSIMPQELLARVVAVSEIWNHYVAGVIVARLPYHSIPTARAKRLIGTSHMNFQSLIVHGLRALSVFSESIGIRLLYLFSFISLVTFFGIIAVVAIRLFTHLAIPGWASNVFGLLVLCLFQTLTLLFLFLFAILSSRSMLGMIPLRDYHPFVRDLRSIYSSQAPRTVS